MAAPKQARRADAARSGGTSAKTRDKGTRGGRPEPQLPSSAGRPRPGNGQGRPAGVAARPAAPRRTASPAEAADGGVEFAPLWLRLTTLIIALAGLGASIYLTIAHYTTPTVLACSDKGFINCAAVTTSPESKVFGIFPVAVLGLAFYVFMVAVTTPWAWRATWPVIRWARLGAVCVGMVFVLYLVYTELITLHELCLWCTSVHVCTFLLFALIVFSAASGYGTPAAASRR
jgi:uncharacterized membrane protein